MWDFRFQRTTWKSLMKVPPQNQKCMRKSEQRELDAVCHTLSIMYVPFADLRDGYSCTIDKQIR